MDISQTLLKKILVATAILLASTATGYVAASMNTPEQEATYCDTLQQDLQQEYPESDSLMCHESGWVTLSQEDDEIENRTDIKCTCTRVDDGELTIFPIRTPG